MLVVMFVILGDVTKVQNEDLRMRLEFVMILSFVTHSSCIAVQFIT